MANIEIDLSDDETLIRVSVMSGMTIKVSHFGTRADAERFAYSKMGRKGCVMSTLDMTPAQLAAHKERQARSAAIMAGLAV